MKPFEYKGFWWTPQNPSDQVYGVLTHYDHEKIVLALAGQLGKFDEQIEVINGSTISGESVTLCDSFPIKGEHTSLSQPREIHSLRVNKVFTGHHFVKTEDIQFNKVVVHFQGLFQWSPFRGARSDIQSTDGKHMGISASLSFEDALNIEINSIHISLHHLTGQNLSFKGLEISNDAAFHIEYPKLTSWSQISSTIGTIQDLLTFSLQTAVEATRVEGFNDEIKEILGNEKFGVPEVTRAKPIAVIYLQKGQDRDTSHFFLQDAIITLRQGHLEFTTLMTKWFEFISKCRGSRTAYLSTYYLNNMHLEDKFSSLCTAIEAFHRETISGWVKSKKDFDELVNIMVNAVTEEDDKKFVREKMKYANEPSLRHRLKAILGGLERFVKFKDKATFIDRTVKTRNYFAHMDSESKSGVLDGIKVYHYGEFLNMIMQILVLKWLGCEDSYITKSLRNRQYYFLREALKNELTELLPEDQSSKSTDLTQ